ncbi:hypothetical protein NLU13_7742 [Sarocladium strictum]|uniref:Uncharacterized protein n=1 Tax=Sarocladium strictum TaxID=5046 RepID=A0AA39GDN9_SARSR|nr:hypothetical protein NLU13_7742 [Sarocladium strictum]
MDALRRRLDEHRDPADHELQVPLQGFEKSGTQYQDSKSSDESGRPPQGDLEEYFQARPRQNWILVVVILLLATTLALLSTFHIVLLQRLSQPGEIGSHRQETQHLAKTHADCGASVAEAKSKGCTWDELTKAWIPSQCPQFGLDEYKTEGMLANPHDNATSWPYYADQDGEVEVNLLVLAEDEDRDPLEPSPAFDALRVEFEEGALVI